MKRLLPPGLLLLLIFVPALHGQETPRAQLEFARGLRDKGYLDLALEQLEKLKGAKDAEVLAVLPLETARLQLAIGKEKPVEQRTPYFAAARAELEGFAKANAGKPAGVQAQLEIARLVSYQAEATLNRALREAAKAQAHEKARPAEAQFAEAGKALDAAAKALGDLAASYKGSDAKEEKRVRAELDQGYWMARLDRAANYVDQARTYIDLGIDKINAARSAKMKEAGDAFKDIALTAKDLNIQYIAMAWLGKCYIETDSPDLATKYLDRVINAKEKAAEAGQRLARYFYIQWVPTNIKLTIKGPARIALVQKLALAWLKDYPTQLKSNEGQGVQFELAEAFYKEGNALWAAVIDKATAKEKDKEKIKEIAASIPPPKAALELFDKAKKYYDAVAEGDSDFAERASQQAQAITFQRLGESAPIAALRTFDDCYLRAQFELAKMRQAADKADRDPGKRTIHEKERQARLGQAILALRRALRLTDPRTPPSKVDETRFLLTTAYFVQGDQERAAVMGEFLAHLKPASKSSAGGAAYALEAYASLLQRDNTEDNRERLRALAHFVLNPENQKAWSEEPVTGVARFQLAMAYLKDQDPSGAKLYKEAIEQLEKLPRSFPGYMFAQSQLVFIALEARDQKELSPERREHYKKVALEALKRLDKLPADPDGNTAAVFFSAKLEQAKFLYEEAGTRLSKKDLPQAAEKFKEMGKYIADLKADMDKIGKVIPADVGDSMALSFVVLGKYATFGLAEVEYRKGLYDAVLALTKTTRDEVEKIKPGPDGKRPLKDFQVASEVLGLHLRAEVQKGKTKEGMETLKLMESLTGEAGDIGAGLTNVLRELVIDLQVQVRELKAAKDTAKLKQTIANFSTFLDAMANKAESKGLELSDLTFLASSFASLEQYDKAANLFKKAPPPKLLASPTKTEFSEKEEAELYGYWRMQLEYAKTLRLGKLDLKKANEVVETLLNHDHGRFHLMAKVEKYLIYEDSGLYGLAIKGWEEVMRDRFIQEKLADDTPYGILLGRKAKDIYFDAYFHRAYCIYKFAQSDAGKSGRAKFTDFAASQLYKLKTASNPEGWTIVEPRFAEFYAAEAPFREAFDALDKKKK